MTGDCDPSGGPPALGRACIPTPGTPAEGSQLEGGAAYVRAANALLQKLPWQVPAIARVTLIGPPIASLILLAVDYFEYWRAISFTFGDFLAAYFVFAIPVGYVFGAVPALLAASLYCALLTLNSRLLLWRPLTRGGVAALCGGLVSGVWFWVLLRSAWGIYALVGALVMASLSLGTPEPAFAGASGSVMASRATTCTPT